LEGGAIRNINILKRINRPTICKDTLRSQYKKKLTNPPKLTEIARAELWKLLGPFTCDWIDKNNCELPTTLNSYVKFYPS